MNRQKQAADNKPNILKAVMLLNRIVCSGLAALLVQAVHGAGPLPFNAKIVDVAALQADPAHNPAPHWRVSIRPKVSNCRFETMFIAPSDSNAAALRQSAQAAKGNGLLYALQFTRDPNGLCMLNSIAPAPTGSVAGAAGGGAAVASSGIGEGLPGYFDKHATAFKSAYRDFGQSQFDEKVDPITGVLTLTYVDVAIPGPNGMDIRVVRKYRSPDPEQIGMALEASLAPQVYGLGWDLIVGMGGVRNAYAKCPGDLPTAIDLQALPQWIDGNGNAEPMVPSGNGWKSASGAFLSCGAGQLTGTTVDGTSILFTPDYRGASPDYEYAPYQVYPAIITDRFGNSLTFDYDTPYLQALNAGAEFFDAWRSSGFMPIKSVTASDGRTVTFEYFSRNSNWTAGTPVPPMDQALRAIHYGTYAITLDYYHLQIDGLPLGPYGKYFLTEVKRSDNQKWQYEYNIPAAATVAQICQPAAGQWVMSKLIHPQGGYHSYTWGKSASLGYRYPCESYAAGSIGGGAYNITFNTNQLRSKMTSDAGTWRYSYTDSTDPQDTVPLEPSLGVPYDVSPGANPAGYVGYEAGRVTGPDKTTVAYRNPRFSLHVTGSGNTTAGVDMWMLGRELREVVYSGTSAAPSALGSVIEIRDFTFQRSYSADTQTIRYYDPNQESLMYPPPVYEYLAWPLATTTKRAGVSYTRSTTYDGGCARPDLITETGQRSRKLAYVYDSLGYCQVTAERLQDEFGGVVSQTIRTLRTDKRAVEREAAYGPSTAAVGLATAFTYWSTGDLATRTDARSYTTYFNDYWRGTPREELHPVEATNAQTESDATRIRLVRVVDDLGRITSETDAEGRTWQASYDGLHRPKLITPARLATSPIVFDYGATTDTVTQGTRIETIVHDGFGRVTSHNNGIDTTTYRYDATGRRTFVSYPGSALGQNVELDALDRPTKLTEPNPADNNQTASTVIAYTDASAQRTVTTPNGATTTLTTEAFGDPDKTWVKQYDLPESQSVSVERNLLGLVTKITNNGVIRERSYDADRGYFLVLETHPELVGIYYERDNNGNATGKRVGSNTAPQTQYSYDGQNRLRVTAPPPNGEQISPVVTNEYYRSGKLKSTTVGGVVSRGYSYDNDDNLTQESVTVDGITRNLGYVYDSLGQLGRVTYPSGRYVELSPDNVGRPTTVSGSVAVVSSTTYWPSGTPRKITFANNVTQEFAEQARPLISGLVINTPSVGGPPQRKIDLSFGYNEVANLQTMTDGLGLGYTRSSTYDGLDRIKTSGTESFTYQKIGDLSTKTGASYTYDDSSRRLSSISGTVSRSYSYDSYANVSSDGRGFTFGHDSLGSLRTVKQNGNNVSSYDYDGHALMAKKTSGVGTTYYLYGKNGRLFGEYDAASTHGKEYFYLGNKLVGQISF